MTTISPDSPTAPDGDAAGPSTDLIPAAAPTERPQPPRFTRIGDRVGFNPAPKTAEPFGPFALGFGSLYITISFFLAAPVMPLEPRWATLTLAFAMGSLLLIPREHMRRMVVDGPVMLMAFWIAITALWSVNPSFAVFQVRRDLPVVIAVSLLAGALPSDVTIRAIRRAIWIAMGITAFALLIDPETRSHAADGIYADPYPGWHGWFIHKNTMAPYMVMGLITTLMFDKEPLRRGLTLAGLAVLLIGSDSATGLSAGMFVVALWVWFRLFHRSGGRWSTGYVVASTAVALCGLMGAIASLSALTSAYGKDLTFSGRTFIWSAVLSAIEKRPFTGQGLGSVFWIPNSITREIWRDVGFKIPHSHSGTLDVVLNFGLIGLVLFTVMFLSSIAMGIRLLRISPVVAEWFLILLAAQFLMGLSENVFLGSWLVYMAAARGVVQRRTRDGDPEPESKPAAKPGGLQHSNLPELTAGSGSSATPALPSGH